MRLKGVAILLGAVALALAGCGRHGAEQVDGKRIIEADKHAGEWMTYGRTYSEQRFSPLDKINAGNVGRLGLAWYADLDTRRGQEGTPLMVDGVLYITTAWSKVMAFDAKTGKPLWSYDPKVPGAWGVKACCDVVNRGAAIWKGKVYVGTIDGRLIALDAKTGQPVWSVQTSDPKQSYTITGAPRVFKDKVIIGNGGAEFGVRGYVTAYDAATGRQVWRFWTVPGDPAKGFEQPILKEAAKTWTGQWWKLGGGGTAWDALVYDPEFNRVYIGVGNGSPWNSKERSPQGGDNLFLSSIVAVDADTGKYVWHYQTTPGESWDYTATQPIMLADLNIGGQVRKVLMQSPKNGFFYVIDRQTGKLISAKPIIPLNWATGIDANGRPIQNPAAHYGDTGKPWGANPGPLGAHSWQPMAFNPKTGLVYIPVNESGFTYIPEKGWKAAPMGFNTGADFGAGAMPQDPAVKGAILSTIHAKLSAWDPVAQKEVWSVPLPMPGNGGVLTTAGGLVLQGNVNSEFAAYDAAKGAKLWSMPTQAPPMGGPMTYQVGGEQYVAVLTGWGGAWALSPGEPALRAGKIQPIGRLLVFKVGGTAKLPPLPPTADLPLNPPPMTASPAKVAEGLALYSRYCGVCHGDTAVSDGVTPDLRHSPLLASDSFFDVVLGGALQSQGMANFSPALNHDQVDSIRAYLIKRAHQAKGDIPAAP